MLKFGLNILFVIILWFLGYRFVIIVYKFGMVIVGKMFLMYFVFILLLVIKLRFGVDVFDMKF